MNVIPLLVFVSLLLVVGALLLFAYSVRHGDHEHADRLALLPLEDERSVDHDAPRAAADPTDPTAAVAEENAATTTNPAGDTRDPLSTR